MQNIITTSPLIWAGLLAGMVMLPILIHLINRLRHKRVRWAAMDFLLASHNKNRNWVRLKQLLLLLARIACLLLILLAVSQVGCDNDNMSRFLGGKVTHHYIIVDDSLSMSDVTAGKSALDRAREAVGLIASRISGRDNQHVTMLRFSSVSHMIQSAESFSLDGAEVTDLSQADLNAVVVDREIERVLLDAADRLQPTLMKGRPDLVLDMVSNLIQQRTSENAVVYLISDFRQVDWSSTEELKPIFDELASASAAVELIRCVDSPNDNLAITSLQPDGSVRVAGVPMMMEVQVTNFGKQLARKIQVSLQSATYPDETTGDVAVAEIDPELNELSTILIDEIAPGETAKRRFPVYFARPGQHAVRASLPGDSISGDNDRWEVTRFASSEKVLVIDGPGSRDGKFISLAMSPGGMTGLQIEQADKSKLRDADDDFLDQYEAVFMLDIDQLEASAANRLRSYVERGGGVVFFAGPSTNLKHYTSRLYADGNGIYPLPLERATSVPEQLENQSADFVPKRHPIFASVMDVDFSPLDLVQIARVVQPPPEWSASDDNPVQVLATVRGDKRLPLVVEKKIGSGTVLAVLTSAGPQWNNWMRNPTFPTTLLLLQDHVSQGRDIAANQFLVGNRIGFSLNASIWQPDVEFVSPVDPEDGDGFDRTRWTVTAIRIAEGDRENEKTARLGQSLSEIDKPGIYERWFTKNNGDRELERLTLNIDPAESQPAIASSGELMAAAEDARIVSWQNFGPGAGSNRGTSLVRILLVILLLVLIAEQWLALSASFHPRSRQDRSNKEPRSPFRRHRQPRKHAA